MIIIKANNINIIILITKWYKICIAIIIEHNKMKARSGNIYLCILTHSLQQYQHSTYRGTQNIYDDTQTITTEKSSNVIMRKVF